MESALRTPSIVTAIFHNLGSTHIFMQARIVCKAWRAVSEHCAWPWIVFLTRLAERRAYSFHTCCMSRTTRAYDLVIASILHERFRRNLDGASSELENLHKRLECL